MAVLNCKICIVGAGPAGSTTSIFLSKFGIPHLLVDASIFPRDKVCGDGIDLRGIRILNLIDPNILKHELPMNNSFTPCVGARLIQPSGKVRDFLFPYSKNAPHEHPFYVSKRKDFDTFLLQKTTSNYATVYQGTKIIAIEKLTDKWVLKTNNDKILEIHCEFLVGADGDHSIVLKYLNERKVDRGHYAASVRQYWKNVNTLTNNNLLEYYTPKKYPFSYFWIFPLPNGEFNVGFIMLSKYIAKKNYNVRKIFDEIITTDPIISPRFKRAIALESAAGWGLPLASLQRKVHGNNWLLVGDAASLISPISGEGIGNAMLSGYMAAHFIQKAVLENDFSESVFENYPKELYRYFKEDIKKYNSYSDKNGKLVMWLINNLIITKIFGIDLFKHLSKKWLNTAYHKSIEVNL